MVLQIHHNIYNIKVFYHQIVNYFQDFNFIIFHKKISKYQKKKKVYLFLEIFKEINGLHIMDQCKLYSCHNGLEKIVLMRYRN
jgi:hypothetical protein